MKNNREKKEFLYLDEVQDALEEAGYFMPEWGGYLATGGGFVEMTDMYGVSYGLFVQEEFSCSCDKEGVFHFFYDAEHHEEASEWESYEFSFKNKKELEEGLKGFKAFREALY